MAWLGLPGASTAVPIAQAAAVVAAQDLRVVRAARVARVESSVAPEVSGV